MTSLGTSTFDDVLEALAAPAPGPAGASAAALTAAMAAAIVVMVARGSRAWAGGHVFAERAAGLMTRLVELADDDAHAVAGLLAVIKAPAGADRAETVALALVAASRPPASIAAAAAEIVELAAEAAARGKPVMRADAVAAALLATAATRSAVGVVETNLAGAHDDEVGATGSALLGQARAELVRATGAGDSVTWTT